MIQFIFLLPVLAIAQVDFFGYYEEEYDHMTLSQNSYNFGYNKLRLDLGSRPLKQVMVVILIDICSMEKPSGIIFIFYLWIQ